MPDLGRNYNPNIKAVLANLAQIVAYDYDYLGKSAERRLANLRVRFTDSKLKFKKAIGINLAKLLRLHPSIKRLILRLAIAQVKGSTRQIDFRHIEEIEDLVQSRPIGSIVDLPGKISVSKRKR